MRSVAEGGTAKRRMIHRAASKLTTIITGVSISSAVLVPIRGTTSRTRMVPSTKPAPKTNTK